MKEVILGKKKYEVGKIVCVGRNYVKHAEELGNEVPEFPLIFLKAPSNLIFSGKRIEIPKYSNEMHHEVELVLLIGKKIKNANAEKAAEAIAGYGVGLDMTLRDVQDKLKAKGHPWTLAKAFDGSAVVSNFIPANKYKLTGKEIITLSVNYEMRQNSTLDKMIFSPVQIVEYISGVMTLEPGDLIFTGTPEGVGKVKPGDRIIGAIQNIGEVEASVK